MSTRAVEQVDDWDTRPFSGGYRGLQDLADEGFSGIVTAGPTRLCMTKGTVVGVLDGSIEDFENASGTAHVAPSPALPLLALMQEGDSEVQAQYYTEETPIREVNGTLSDGNFTGYIELSENVLSGDYYVVYHQGRSMSVAYVGNSKQLLTEDEAFQRANDEVGIYEVVDAGVDVTEIPEPAGAVDGSADAAAGAAAAAETADGDATDVAESADTTADSGSDPAAGAGAGSDPEPATGSTETAPEATDASAPEATEADVDGSMQSDAGSTTGSRDDHGGAERGGADRSADGDRGTTRAADSRSEGRESSARQTTSRTDERERRDRGEADSRGRRREGESRAPDESRSRGGTGSANGTRREGTGRSGGPTGGGSAGGTRRQGHGGTEGTSEAGAVGDLETRSIPSLDPSLTTEPENESAGGTNNSVASPQPEPEPRGTPGRDQSRDARQGTDARGTVDEPADEPPDAGGPPGAGAGDEAGEIERLESELDDREGEIADLEADLEAREERIEELETELEELRSERDDLRERIERMEGRIDDLRAGEGGESIADRQRMGPGEAIEGTNLFIRYGSKGEATLENAHDGSASREEVNTNLDIQYHTQFDAGDVAVDGDPFDEYLEGTIQYRFVEWVVRVLPYEIRDTGHEGALKDLYDAMPRIDRAELNGAVSVIYEEEGEEQRTQERFDVVLRDRMGNPLAVANMNESRDPASQGMMEGLITAAKRVSESKESLAGAFLVTSSFFEPEAMEAASQATGGGLLSRDKRESFVKLSRKEGFHLCLVEAREAQFNLSVPEI